MRRPTWAVLSKSLGVSAFRCSSLNTISIWSSQEALTGNQWRWTGNGRSSVLIQAGRRLGACVEPLSRIRCRPRNRSDGWRGRRPAHGRTAWPPAGGPPQRVWTLHRRAPHRKTRPPAWSAGQRTDTAKKKKGGGGISKCIQAVPGEAQAAVPVDVGLSVGVKDEQVGARPVVEPANERAHEVGRARPVGRHPPLTGCQRRVPGPGSGQDSQVAVT